MNDKPQSFWLEHDPQMNPYRAIYSPRKQPIFYIGLSVFYYQTNNSKTNNSGSTITSQLQGDLDLLVNQHTKTKIIRSSVDLFINIFIYLLTR